MRTWQKPKRGLDLVQKTKVAFAWLDKELLTPAAYRVLLALLEHQNPWTGRCDPSVRTLMRETGYRERQVRSALTELRNAGVIVSDQPDRDSTNDYVIRSVEECVARVAEFGILVKRHGKQVQFRAARSAGKCRDDLRCSAPKKRSEKRLEKGDVAADQPDSQPEQRMLRHEFEQAMVLGFQQSGFSYEDLLSLPTAVLDDLWDRYRRGELSESDALRLHLRAQDQEGP